METTSKPSKALNISLWVVQSLLSIMFIMAGTMNTVQPIEKLAPMMPWVTHVSPLLVRFVGISQLLGGIGLLLPSILRIKPQLTAWAAIGIVALLTCAVIFHISIGEINMIGVPIAFGLISAFIAWGRMKKAVIEPKN